MFVSMKYDLVVWKILLYIDIILIDSTYFEMKLLRFHLMNLCSALWILASIFNVEASMPIIDIALIIDSILNIY